jgi:hypothetical protein
MDKKDKNVKDIPMSIRCVRKKIKHDEKNLDIWIMTPSPALAKLTKIIVTKEFFKDFNKEEQKALIYHERYHQKLTTILKSIMLELRGKRSARWFEEFSADKYAAKKCGKAAVLGYLYKAKECYARGVVEYNFKTHPPVVDRINAIKSLKILHPSK